jgi:hypothetical protein
MNIFQNENNSWLRTSRNVRFDENTQVLEAELETMNGEWKYNRLEIHPLLKNKPLHNNNGFLNYGLSNQDDDEIMKQLFPAYPADSPVIDEIEIARCVMLSVDLPKYNNIRTETLNLLRTQFTLPPIDVHFGYTSSTVANSRFCCYMTDIKKRNELTCGMLEIFDKFATTFDNNPCKWLLFFEDDVRPINLPNGDLRKLYNIPVDAEMIRPYIGTNEPCDLKTVTYNISYGSVNNHALYLSASACRKVVNYALKYKWKHDADIDIYKLAKRCGKFPTGYDGWSLSSCDGNNNITEQLAEDEKLIMYSISNVIMNQTSMPCV